MMKHLELDEYGSARIEDIAAARRFYDAGAKRAIDVLLSLALVPVVAPVIGVLALLVMLGDGGRPLFGHVRVGRRGRPFRCWKIRTMVPDAEDRLVRHLAENPHAAAEWMESRKLSDDPRVTRFGDFLRRTSLDELPQLWNVLRGDMSFVGPRPVPEDELELYGAARASYCEMRPGITGLWQVSGRNELSYAHRVALDLEYLRRMSPALDAAVMLRTVLVLVRPTGR
jgi:lipopolysaccharide/colanic/teichoic acid biosynthesis glycosyltransferase